MQRDSAEKPDKETEHDEPAPGPVDHGGHGGMATREVAPEISEDRAK
jgi:hypothetical protein